MIEESGKGKRGFEFAMWKFTQSFQEESNPVSECPATDAKEEPRPDPIPALSAEAIERFNNLMDTIEMKESKIKVPIQQE